MVDYADWIDLESRNRSVNFATVGNIFARSIDMQSNSTSFNLPKALTMNLCSGTPMGNSEEISRYPASILRENELGK